MTFRKFSALTLASLLVSATTIAGSKNIVQTAVDAGSFKTLAKALQAADLVDALQGPGPFTVFAPTDDAFAALPSGALQNLLKPENKAQLQTVLKYHVVSGAVPASAALNLRSATTLAGQPATISFDGGVLRIDGATVVTSDINCSNGVIHVIDRVIMPETKTIVGVAQQAGAFNTLLAAAKAADLAGVLSGPGPFTVFAPTDDAFAKLPAGTVENLLKPENREQLANILKFHVVSGQAFATDALAAQTPETLIGQTVAVRIADGSLRVNDARIVQPDVAASNGVVHVIDTVLLPNKDRKVGKASPREMIREAINRGAPMFNHGDAAGCAQVYMTTARTLVSSNHAAMSCQARKALMAALEDAERADDAHDRAWTLRRALDDAYMAMM